VIRDVTAVNAKPVFVDVDTGIDDALALVYLLASLDAELVGIASTGGNVAVDQVCVNNLGLLELCRITGVPVSKGADQPLCCPLRPPGKAHGPNGLGYAELPPSDRQLTGYDAATAWVRAAHDHPGELIGVATGPLTNLALALRAEPALPTLLRRLVIMGGAYDYRGNTNPVAEWNISVDPEAAAEVFAAWTIQTAERLPVLCGLDLTQHVAMTPGILARLAAAADATTAVMSADDERGTRSAASNPLIRVIEDAMRFYFEAHYDHGYGFLAHLHDPLAVAVALDPPLVATQPATVDVELTGTLTRGMTVTDWSGRWGREPNALIGVGVDPAAFFDRFVDRVGPFASRLG
jgi:purine nucleosidase